MFVVHRRFKRRNLLDIRVSSLKMVNRIQQDPWGEEKSDRLQYGDAVVKSVAVQR